MKQRLIEITASSLPGFDDFVMSASRLMCAGVAYAGSTLVPAPLDAAALLVAQTFVIMALWRLIGLVENRIQAHVVSFARVQFGLDKSDASLEIPPI